MKRIVGRIALFLLLFVFLVLIGCNAESAYSKTIQEASNADGFGSGSKIAVYDEQKKYYVKKFISEQNLANTPEEIGAILSVSEDGKHSRLFILSDARNNKRICSIKQKRSVKSIDEWVTKQWVPYWTDRTLRDLYESGAPCNGKRLAVYDGSTKQFGFSHKYVPTRGLTKATVDQIGAFVLIEEEGKTPGQLVKVALRATGGDAPDIASSGFNNQTMQPYKAVRDWINAEADAYFAGRDFTALLETGNLGGGDKIIGFDVSREIYTTRYIPEDIAATSPEDAGLIAEIEIKKRTKEVSYYLFGGIVPSPVQTNTETVTIKLVDAVSHTVLGETTFSSGTPTELPAGTTEYWSQVDNQAFGDWLRTEREAWLHTRE